MFTVRALLSGRPRTPLLQIAHCSGRRLLDPENPGELSNLQKHQWCHLDSRVLIPMIPPIGHRMVCDHTVSGTLWHAYRGQNQSSFTLTQLSGAGLGSSGLLPLPCDPSHWPSLSHLLRAIWLLQNASVSRRTCVRFEMHIPISWIQRQ